MLNYCVRMILIRPMVEWVVLDNQTCQLVLAIDDIDGFVDSFAHPPIMIVGAGHIGL